MDNLKQITMDKLKQLAALLNGREYMKETNADEEAFAWSNRIVIVLGASDDLCELRGAINDELGSYEGTKFYVNQSGLVDNECNDQNCPYFQRAIESAHAVRAIFDSNGWDFKTDIPHEKFEIMEDGEHFGFGICFCLDNLDG